MEPSNLVEGELYVLRDYSVGYAPPRYREEYAGKAAIYMGFEPEYMEHFGETFERYKFLLDGELRYMPEQFLKFLDLPDVQNEESS